MLFFPCSDPCLGERERELKRAIQARFDVVEPPAIYLKIGNEHLGKKVVRTFGKKRKVRGEVVGWLPAVGDDEALWKVIEYVSYRVTVIIVPLYQSNLTFLHLPTVISCSPFPLSFFPSFLFSPDSSYGW